MRCFQCVVQRISHLRLRPAPAACILNGFKRGTMSARGTPTMARKSDTMSRIHFCLFARCLHIRMQVTAKPKTYWAHSPCKPQVLKAPWLPRNAKLIRMVGKTLKNRAPQGAAARVPRRAGALCRQTAADQLQPGCTQTVALPWCVYASLCAMWWCYSSVRVVVLKLTVPGTSSGV